MHKTPLYTESSTILAEMDRLRQSNSGLFFRRPGLTPKFLHLLELRDDREAPRLVAAQLHRGDTIGPCSFSLPLLSRPEEVLTFTIGEAKVAWSSPRTDGMREVGISFQASSDETAKIKSYIVACSREATSGMNPEPAAR